MNDTNYEVLELKEKKDKKKNYKLILIIPILIIIILFVILVYNHTNNINNIENAEINTNDKIAPTLMDITIYSDNENNRQYAKIGDFVYLTFKSDEQLENIPIVCINSQKVKVIKNDNTYIAQYEVTEQYNEDFIITFNISGYKDKAGNVGIDVFNTNDFSKVIISALNKNIEKVEIQSIKFDKNDIYMLVNDTTELSLLIEPINAIYKDVVWQSSDVAIATVKDGVITAKMPGQTTITAIVENIPISANVWVVNDKVEATSLKIKEIPTNIYVGESFKLITEILPTNTTNTNIKWTSSNTNVATITDGTFFAKKEGTVTIKATLDKITTSIDLKIKTKIIDVSSITLNTNNVTLYAGNTINLIASISPYNATNKDIKWSSSDTSIATVNENGVVTAKNNGIATIKATIGEKSAVATICVTNKKIDVTSINILPIEATINIGEKVILESTIFPLDATDKNIKWSSSNTNIATVNNGVVTGKSSGTAIITARVDGKSITSTINVKEPIINVSSIYLNASSASININQTVNFIATILPSNATNKTIIWTSSNPTVATVNDDGVVTGRGNGTAIITATSEGKSISATVTVSVPVTSITLNKTNFSMDLGEITTLIATINPSTASTKTITWTSSNPTIATVNNNGIVTAKSYGTATITATAGGKSTSATITIKNSITSLEIFPTSLNIKLGATATIEALINSNPANTNIITWTSSNPNIASVNNMGIVTANSKGTATITATAGGITKSTTINVIVPVTGINLNKTTETIYLNSNTKTTTLIATITPSNADNKTISWSSNNTAVATINNGKVTAISPGTATITAKTADGNKTATYTITVKKKIIFIIGASQVTRMKEWVSSYTSTTNNYTYTTSSETLNFINDSGTGFAFQTTTGWNKVKNKITAYSNVKKYIDFYVFFPMAGNDIKSFTCNPAYPNHEKFISSSNSYINQYANDYNNIIDDIKKSGYQVQGYVVSVHPVVVSQGSGAEYLVTNNNENACKLKYRSNEKYYTFNKAMEAVLKSSTYTENLKYLSLFSYIMKTNDAGTNFSYKVTYDTTDGIHWDEKTTKYYVKLMLNEPGVL